MEHGRRPESERDRELRALLARGLAECASAASEAQIEALARLAELLARWGQRINLSGHREPEAIASRLLLGAAALLEALPRFESLADLGSGAGVPGLPTAILRPEARIVLVEARLRRHHFQRAAIRALGLRNARALLGRMEELEPEPCDVALAQAVGAPGQILGWLAPWARPGGWLALPAAATSAAPSGAFERHAYRVPAGGPERILWLGRAG